MGNSTSTDKTSVNNIIKEQVEIVERGEAENIKASPMVDTDTSLDLNRNTLDSMTKLDKESLNFDTVVEKSESEEVSEDVESESDKSETEKINLNSIVEPVKKDDEVSEANDDSLSILPIDKSKMVDSITMTEKPENVDEQETVNESNVEEQENVEENIDENSIEEVKTPAESLTESTTNLIQSILDGMDDNKQSGGYRRRCNKKSKKSMKGGCDFCGKINSQKFDNAAVDMSKY